MSSNLFACGVYAIECTVNGRLYIGSTINSIAGRAALHISFLKNNKHNNHELQADWNAYGQNSFRCTVLQEFAIGTPIEEVRRAEQVCIDGCHCTYNRIRAIRVRPVKIERATKPAKAKPRRKPQLYGKTDIARMKLLAPRKSEDDLKNIIRNIKRWHKKGFNRGEIVDKMKMNRASAYRLVAEVIGPFVRQAARIDMPHRTGVY